MSRTKQSKAQEVRRYYSNRDHLESKMDPRQQEPNADSPTARFCSGTLPRIAPEQTAKDLQRTRVCHRTPLAKVILAEEAYKDIYSSKAASLQEPPLWSNHCFDTELKFTVYVKKLQYLLSFYWVLSTHLQQKPPESKLCISHLKTARLLWLHPPRSFLKAMLYCNAELKLFSPGNSLKDSRIWPYYILSRAHLAFGIKRHRIFSLPNVRVFFIPADYCIPTL